MHIPGPRGVEQRARLPQDLRPAKTKQKISGTLRVRAQHPAASYPALQARRHRLSALAERAWIPPIRDLRNGACQSHHVTVITSRTGLKCLHADRQGSPRCTFRARITAPGSSSCSTVLIAHLNIFTGFGLMDCGGIIRPVGQLLAGFGQSMGYEKVPSCRTSPGSAELCQRSGGAILE
jgi:hypothetical protein